MAKIPTNLEEAEEALMKFAIPLNTYLESLEKVNRDPEESFKLLQGLSITHLDEYERKLCENPQFHEIFKKYYDRNSLFCKKYGHMIYGEMIVKLLTTNDLPKK
jgi:hypothetical protein